MAVTRVGARTTANSNSTSFVTTFGQAPTAGNLLLLSAASSKGTPEPTIGLTGAGWTLLAKAWGTHGAAGGGVYVWGKFATSTETAPTITSSGTATVLWTMDEWSGLDPTYLPSFAAWTATIVTSASPQTLNASRTSTVDKEWVFGVLGGRCTPAGIPTPTWGGGLSANFNTQTATTGGAYLYTSTAGIATTGSTLSGSVQFTNNLATDANTFDLLTFREASTALVRTGTASMVLGGSGTSVEVEKSTAPATVVLAAAATSVVVFRKAGTASLALTGTATSRQVEKRTSVGSVQLAATATAKTVYRRTGTASLTLGGTAVGVPVGGIKTRTGTASVVLVGTASATTTSVVVRTGTATVKLVASGPTRVVQLRAGTAGLQVAATGSGRVVFRRTATGDLILAAAATARTVHPRAGLGFVALNQQNVVRSYVIERRAGLAELTLAAGATGTVVEWRTATATTTLTALGTVPATDYDAPRNPSTVITVHHARAVIRSNYAKAELT